jgi:hypothetical protein
LQLIAQLSKKLDILDRVFRASAAPSADLDFSLDAVCPETRCDDPSLVSSRLSRPEPTRLELEMVATEPTNGIQFGKTMAQIHPEAVISAKVAFPVWGVPLYRVLWRNGVEACQPEKPGLDTADHGPAAPAADSPAMSETTVAIMIA